MCILYCMDRMLNPLDLWHQFVYHSAFYWGELWIAGSGGLKLPTLIILGSSSIWFCKAGKWELKLSTKNRHSHKDPRVEEQSPALRYFPHSSLWITDRAAKPEGSVQLAFRSPSFLMYGPSWMQGYWFYVNCGILVVIPFSTEMKWQWMLRSAGGVWAAYMLPADTTQSLQVVGVLYQLKTEIKQTQL